MAALSFWTSITCLLPILPAYIQDIGATTKQVGFVMGSFAIGLLASRIWLGKLADQRSRKLVILIGTIVSTIAPLGYLWFNLIHQLMLVRAFHGISIAAFTTGYSALIVDLSPPKQKGELIGYMSLAVPTGMAIGPALGSFLETNGSYPLLFSVSSSCGFLALILSSQVRDNKPSFVPVQSGKVSSLHQFPNRSFWQLFSSLSLIVPTVLLLLIGCLFGTLVTFLPLYVRQLSFDFNAGFFYTAAAIASFTVRFLVGKASDRYGRGLFISISLGCYFAAMVLLSIGNSGNVFLGAGILQGAAGGMMIPVTLALISDRSVASERGTVFAFCVSGFDVGVALAGPVFGSLSIGYRNLYAIASGMSVIAMLIFITSSNKSLAYSWRFAMGNAPDFYALDLDLVGKKPIR
jgi:MFS family permease